MMANEITRSIRRSIRRIGKSPEYLGLAGFIAFFERGCSSYFIEKITKRYAKEVKILFRLLKKRIEKEMKKFLSPADKMNFVRAVHRHLPAFSRFYDLNI